MRGLQDVAKGRLVAGGTSRVDPAHQDPVDKIRVVAIRFLAHLGFDLVGDRAESLGLLAPGLDRLDEFAPTGELLAGRDMLGLVGHLAYLPDEVGQPVNTVMLPVPDIAIRAVSRVEGAAAEPMGEVRVVVQKPAQGPARRRQKRHIGRFPVLVRVDGVNQPQTLCLAA